MTQVTRESLKDRTRELRNKDPNSEQAKSMENELLRDINAYIEEHPFQTDEMGIRAGESDAGARTKICVSQEDIDELMAALRQYKRVEMEGDPGFGRVFAAQELAYILIGKEWPEHVAIAQFDHSYTFADFMGTDSPAATFLEGGGLFYRMCRAAAKSPDPYVLVINETAVGKVNSIFEQMDELISTEAGQDAIRVLYGTNEPFTVPDNVYVLSLTPVTSVYSKPSHSFTERKLTASMEISELIAESQAADLQELREALSIVEAINSVVTGSTVLGEHYEIKQNFICPCTLRGGDDVLAFTAERDLDPLIAEYTRLWSAMWHVNNLHSA